jgi:hypothetical protein
MAEIRKTWMAPVAQALKELARGQKDLAAEDDRPDPHVNVMIAIEDCTPWSNEHTRPTTLLSLFP